MLTNSINQFSPSVYATHYYIFLGNSQEPFRLPKNEKTVAEKAHKQKTKQKTSGVLSIFAIFHAVKGCVTTDSLWRVDFFHCKQQHYF